MQIVTFQATVAVLLVAAIFLISNFSAVQSSPLSSQHELNVYNFPESSTSNQETSIEEEPPTTSTTSTTTTPTSTTRRYIPPYNFNRNSTTLRPWINVRQSEELMLLEGTLSEDAAECCPSILETTSPIGGINAEGDYVQLYADGEKKQLFHEVSCRDDILDQPCRYMERRFHNRSRCVQKYSLSYAIVLIQPVDEDDEIEPEIENEKMAAPFGTEKFMLDHIQIRSGCSCEITPNKKLKEKKSLKGKKKKKNPSEGT